MLSGLVRMSGQLGGPDEIADGGDFPTLVHLYPVYPTLKGNIQKLLSLRLYDLCS